MARVLGLASLLLLLSSAACCADPPPVTAPGNASPVTNLTAHPRRKMFSWNYRRNVTEHRCQLDTPPNSTTRQSPRVRGDHAYFCHFPNAVLHRGATFTVHVTADGHPYRSVLDFRNSGREGSGAVNFSCRIHHVRLMTCSWTPGPAAPTDVQYRLYRWSSMRDEDEVECPHYTAAPAGTHIGCRFGELTEPQQKAYSFLVTGTSKETPVPFLDFGPLKTIEMEKPDPPANLTVLHNGSHHVIQWNNPRTGSDVASGALYYELDIHREQCTGQFPDSTAKFPRGVYSAGGKCERTHSDHGEPIPRRGMKSPHKENKAPRQKRSIWNYITSTETSSQSACRPTKIHSGARQVNNGTGLHETQGRGDHLSRETPSLYFLHGNILLLEKQTGRTCAQGSSGHGPALWIPPDPVSELPSLRLPHSAMEGNTDFPGISLNLNPASLPSHHRDAAKFPRWVYDGDGNRGPQSDC
ncbi:granulocyte-macrophage colony-stimulating factor receptor subunit alpha-like, partial [Saccopteryx leptura]|uniref:granulocyte-macrophage colony-stimulating factor receptor subunit alpha-like n=1 Tax=Saccopteryx leptura TaxID=249018 RepID=UPI00339C9A55